MKIILIGFMGTGKSTLAPLLAKKLDLEFIEMDDLVEKKAGKRIEKIFAEDGETAFREFEILVANDLKDKDDVVISCGGGVVLNKIILDYLRSNGVVVGLTASFPTIVAQDKPEIPRPLFKDKTAAKKLYEFRKILYERYADKMITTDNKTPEEVVKEITKEFK